MSDLERIVAERIAADAQAQMGHADPAMTRHYSHPTDAGQKSAAERIGRLLAEG